MRTSTVAIMAAAMLVAACTIAATPATAPKVDPTEIGSQVKLTKDQFERLTEKMIEVAAQLEKTDPESAKAIRAAVDKAKKEAINENMGKVVAQLTRSIAEAKVTEGKVAQDLNEVLRLLREGAVDPDKHKDYVDWLKAMVDKVDKMIDEQKELERQSAENVSPASKEMQALNQKLDDIVKEQQALLDQTQKLGEGDSQTQKLAQMRDMIDDLIAKQEKLNLATEKAPVDERPAMGEVQKKIGKGTDDAKGKLDDAAKDPKLADAMAKGGADKDALKNASDAAASASKEMAKASDALGKSDDKKASDPQKQALSDLKDAKKALENAIAKTGDKTPAGELAKKQEELGKKTDDLSKAVEKTASKAGMKADSSSMSKASSSMGKASQQLGGQNSQKASEHQKDALKELSGKKEELAQLQRKMEDKPKSTPQDQKPKQDDLTKKTEDAQKEMDEQAKKQNADKSPGKDSMANAGKNSSKASQDLGQQKSSDANKDQQKAIDDLQKAKDELAQALDDEQKKDDEEKLAKIDAMLTTILEQQKNVSSATTVVYGKRTGEKQYDRKETQELGSLSDKEGALGADVTKVRKMLTDEKATVVFPVILDDVNKKMVEVQKELSQKEAGQLTQLTQKEIEQSLEEMIKAIRDQLLEHRDKAKGGGGGAGGGQGGGGKPPLIPPIAELKMLRLMQLQVNNATVVVSKAVEDGKLPKDQADVKHKKLADDEKKVQTLTEEMKKKLKADQPPPTPDM